MKLLYFHQHFSTPEGAAGTRSYEFARRLVRRGHQVTIVCGSYRMGQTGLNGPFRRGARRGIVDGIEVVEFELPYSNADSFFRRARTFLRFSMLTLGIALKPGYDLLIATSTPLTVAIPGIIAKLIRRRRFIFEVRDLWPELPRAMGAITNPFALGLMEVLETLAYRCADACVALAPGIMEGIRRKTSAKRIAMIPNGCDLDLVADPGKAALPDQVEQLLKRMEGKMKCIFSGTHGIANGLDAVLDAARVLKARGREDVLLLFVGAGMLKPALVERAQREKLDNCVFLDPLPKRVLIALQGRVDVGMMILKNVPAFYNGTSPNKFFDYLASGLPVLINYPGWLADLVTQEECGVAVPPDDPEAFADALELLSRSAEGRRAMGLRANALAKRAFSRDALSQQFAEFVESVANAQAHS